MIRVSQEKFMERLEAVPQELRDFMVSLEVGDMLWLIGEVHHLAEEKIQRVAGILGYIVLGLIHIEDLAKEIVAETNIDRRLAEELAREIKLKILNPIIPQLQQFYHYGSAGAAAPSAGTVAASATSPQPAIMKPAFAPGGQGVGAGQDTPFILHEEQKEIEQARPMDETLVRPSFYEAGGSSKEQVVWTEKPQAARLEIGGVEEVRKEGPRVGKTEESPIRVVHYSGPQTPVDPFAPQQGANGKEQRVEPQQLPREIHPENIVDLKDLPK